MLLLQVHHRVTARELAERLEVSERTILRDMEALSRSGIPVFAERGANGGWQLMDNYEANLTGLSLAEIQSLFLTKPPRLLADLGLRQAAESALIKLFAALPSIYRRDAEFVRQRIHIDGAGWQRSREDLTFLPVVQEAIWQEKKLKMTYRRADNTSSERTVDPLGLVAKANTWYLVALVEGEYRTYRISRIAAATVGDEACIRPDGLDLAVHWEKSSNEFRANLPRYPVIVRAAPGLLDRMRWTGRFSNLTRIEEPGSDGWQQIHIQFQVDWEARDYLLGCGPDVEVISPPELREQIANAARAVVELYAHKSG
jgi:predicted DNA-binding transcriptional regulator YafY